MREKNWGIIGGTQWWDTPEEAVREMKDRDQLLVHRKEYKILGGEWAIWEAHRNRYFPEPVREWRGEE